MTRRVTQITVHDGHLICLCDDGTLWFQGRNPGTMDWFSMPDIPQVPRERVNEFNGTMTRPGGAREEKTVERLVNEVLMEGQGSAESEFSDAPAKNGPKSHPPRKAPMPAKTAPDKPTPAKAKTKHALGSWLPQLPRKYWIALGASSSVLVLMWLLTPPGNPDAATLAKQALSAAKEEDRVTATLQLVSHGDPATIPMMDRLMKESGDAQVLTRVIPALAVRRTDIDSAELFLDKLNHQDKLVRQAAFEGLKYVIKLTPEELEAYQPDGPDAQRAAASAQLKEKYKKRPIPQ